MNSSSLLWGLLYGSIGMGYFVYGKKQQRFVALISGIALMVFPYFITNTILGILIALVLVGLPFFMRY